VKLKHFIKEIDGSLLTCADEIEQIEIEGGYISDLLSDVMGNAKKNDAWVTIMRHLNVVAVASLTGISVIIFSKKIIPDEAVIKKADIEEICLVSSPLSTFEIAGKLYQMLHGK
jgi:hypothetical protein